MVEYYQRAGRHYTATVVIVVDARNVSAIAATRF